MRGKARLRVSRDAKEIVWRSVIGRNVMISERCSTGRGNSEGSFDGAIMVVKDKVIRQLKHMSSVAQ